MTPSIRPLKNYALVAQRRRSHTQSGLVLPDTALGYDTIEVVDVGPECQSVKAGDCVMLMPGRNVLIVLNEHPDHALVAESDIIAVDERDHSTERRLEVVR